MRLVEILAREMGEWPEGVDEIFQDYDRELRYMGWNDSTLTGKRTDDLADDHRRLGKDAPAGVTREMWEAERAKLASTTEWDGEGLPPVGTDCEVEIYLDEWFKCAVVGHYEGRVVIVLANKESAHIANPDQLRPIRTPEQIAAQEREEAVQQMLSVAEGMEAGLYMICCALYDAGYRKQEKDQ